MSDWIVTIVSLLKYANDSKAAQGLLDDANNEMRQAAQALYEMSKGDFAEAFNEEQNKLYNWVVRLMEIGSEYIQTVTNAAKKYEDNENNLMSKMS